MTIPLSAPDIGELEISYVTDVLRSGHLSLGPKLAQFEEQFAKYIGTRYAVAANSGTSGLHMCIRALGIGTGDEVITTSFSFVASTNCLLYEGAAPCFVDIDPRTLNIDSEAIGEFLRNGCRRTADGVVVNRATGRTVKAILPVHVFGMPCDIEAIVELAREYGLLVLEDACEAIGAECSNRRLGSFGNASVFAFYPNKQITTGEGGMVVTDDARIAEICRSLRNQGRDADASWLKHVRLGYNYRLNDIQAALGLAQLERIEELLEARAAIARMYSERLSGHGGLTLPEVPSRMKRSWFVYVVQFKGSSPQAARERVRKHLQSKGVASQVYFPAIHRQPYLESACLGVLPHLPNTDWAADTCLALPFSSKLCADDIQLVCDELVEALELTANLRSTDDSPSVSDVVEARL